ncbi:MAG: heme ABC transporter substrate-binding protein IsdE [Coriobacteriales bacterium]|nr:heme ABC transporter substrate-binding protein IsdE [Coriobacteriales bacterium]
MRPGSRLRPGSRPWLAAILLATVLLSGGCVDQHPPAASSDGARVAATDAEGTSEATLPADAAQPAGVTLPADAPASAAGPSAASDAESLRVVATSMATVQIMERLDVNLVGIPHSDLSEPPARYAGLPEIGMPMSPDMEVLSALKPDWVFSPISLQPDLKPKYEAAGLNAAFLNLRSVEGMYRSISDLGELLDRRQQAQALVKEYEDFRAGLAESLAGREQPRVLVLMGLPGSYIVATENSYVGNLVKLAGGINVYAGESEEFINVNTEDMAARDPDIILRAAHALPDKVVEMFAEEFVTNDIWKHFRAVQQGRVYDLPYQQFGMSATFNYPEALATLQPMLYGDGR